MIDSESISLQFIGSNVQREYSKAYNQLNSCSHFKEQLNAPIYDRRREDPLMSDLMWEKVDPSNECIPRMKQPNISSEDETSFAYENDSHSNLISDTRLKYRSYFSNDRKSLEFLHKYKLRNIMLDICKLHLGVSWGVNKLRRQTSQK